MEIRLSSRLFHDRVIVKLELISPGDEEMRELRIDPPGPAYDSLRSLVDSLQRDGKIDAGPGYGLNDHVMFLSDVSYCDGGTLDMDSVATLDASLDSF